ncbi:MAG: cytochrome-c peroxidase [Bacteroidia bacterium]|nr:cytochrome-c peroxidase [Bacteroidia bacterium]NNJ56414.1 cytochrome-c peroxidase [Bacteroidia bacterium]
MNKLVFILFLFLGLYACKDVVNEIPDTPFNTTAYSFANDSLLHPVKLRSDNIPTNEGVHLGRMLFYDPILSADSSQSCGSCHMQELAFTDNGTRFSTGIRGMEGKRNAMPIFNLMWHVEGFFWDGRAKLLRHQSLLPIQDPLEMDETLGNVLVKLNNSDLYKEHFKKAFNVDEIDEEHLSFALEQFMITIFSGDSKFDRVQKGLETFTQEEEIGRIVFNAESIPLNEENDRNNPINYGGDCFHCHGESNLFKQRDFSNNGLDETLTDLGRGEFTGIASDNGKFKVPSLRNIEKTAPYMHDGRFNTLEEVVDFYMSGVQANSPNIDAKMHALQDSVYLSPAHRAALVSFLKTLTDDTYLTNEKYSNPFK